MYLVSQGNQNKKLLPVEENFAYKSSHFSHEIHITTSYFWIIHFDTDNEALINEYFSSEKVDQAAEHCLRLIGSKTMVSSHDTNPNYHNNPDESTLSYTARKLKWRLCILKELDRINRGLYSWNIGSLFQYHKDTDTEE
ncbi:unnamed protein product [Schistosoma turkestanicum]|nr:unnamed protein product [Schistosoma turkestanicum]